MSIALVVAFSSVHRNYSRQEQGVMQYCNSNLIKTTLRSVSDKARELGLVVTIRRTVAPASVLLEVTAGGEAGIGSSACHMIYDGQSITDISFNPWYH